MPEVDQVEQEGPYRVILVGCHQAAPNAPSKLDEYGRSINTPGCDYCADLVLYGSNEACPKCGTTGPLNLF